MHTVVYASNGRDADRLTLSVRSVLRNIGPDTRIVVLTSDSSAFADLPVTCINPDRVMEANGLLRREWHKKWPFAANYRLVIPLLEAFAGDSRILYLDTDTIVRTPVALRLFTLDSLGCELIGVSDTPKAQGWYDAAVEKPFFTGPVREELQSRVWGWRGQDCRRYVNSGVLVFCLDEIRANGLDWWRRRIGWYRELCNSLGHPDQDFLNVCCRIRADLSWKFNAIGSPVDSRSHIQHFCGRKGLMAEVAALLGIDKDVPDTRTYLLAEDTVAQILARAGHVRRFVCLANKVSVGWDALSRCEGFNDPEGTGLVLFNTADLWPVIPEGYRTRFPLILHVRRYHRRKHNYIGSDCVTGDNVVRLLLGADGSPLPGMAVRLDSAQQAIVAFTDACTVQAGRRREPTTGAATAATLLRLSGCPVELVGFVDDERVVTREHNHNVPVEHRVLGDLGAVFAEGSAS